MSFIPRTHVGWFATAITPAPGHPKALTNTHIPTIKIIIVIFYILTNILYILILYNRIIYYNKYYIITYNIIIYNCIQLIYYILYIIIIAYIIIIYNNI